MRALRVSPVVSLLAIAMSTTATAQPVPQDTLARALAEGSFIDLKVAIPALKREHMTIAFSRNRQSGELRAKVGYEDESGATDYTPEAPVRFTSANTVALELPRNRFGLLRVEADAERKKNVVLWQTRIAGKLHYEGGKTTAFSATDQRGDELDGKPGCFSLAGDAGFAEGSMEVRMRYAEDGHENEDVLAAKANENDWTLVARELDYQEKSDVFTIATAANGELRALDLLSREARVICATRLSNPAGAPDFEVRGIPAGTVLGAPLAQPAIGVSIVQKWLEDFFKGTPVRIGDVRLGRGAQYSVAVNGPSPKVKFDSDDGAWIQLNLIIKIGSNAGPGASGLVDTINIQIQDAYRAKAPTTGKEPPEQLYELLKYAEGFDQTKTAWGKRMDNWQRTFATFLAAKYNGQLIGNQ